MFYRIRHINLQTSNLSLLTRCDHLSKGHFKVGAVRNIVIEDIFVVDVQKFEEETAVVKSTRE